MRQQHKTPLLKVLLLKAAFEIADILLLRYRYYYSFQVFIEIKSFSFVSDPTFFSELDQNTHIPELHSVIYHIYTAPIYENVFTKHNEILLTC